MIAVFLLLLTLLGIYSYSQIDLNLTVSQWPPFLQFQSTMIDLGYYNRPVSAAIFLLLIAGLFTLYLLLLRKTPHLTCKHFLIGAVVIGLVTILSYPGFSYDFFNYLFDAKIITTYGQNPYLFKALDFPSDPWIRFMHWVHRTYPYGPGWLLLTVPFSLAGLTKLVPTVILFKLLFFGNYVLGLWLISKIYGIINPAKRNWALVFYGLNPLMLVEGLISPHIDAMMATTLLASFYFFVLKKKWWSLGALLFSGSIKFLTWALIPLLGIKSLSFEKFATWSLLLLSLILIPVIAQREFYAWYLLPLLACATMLSNNKGLHYAIYVASVALIIQYAAYLYTGDYGVLSAQIKTVLFVSPLLLGALFYRMAVKKLERRS